MFLQCFNKYGRNVLKRVRFHLVKQMKQVEELILCHYIRYEVMLSVFVCVLAGLRDTLSCLCPPVPLYCLDLITPRHVHVCACVCVSF